MEVCPFCRSAINDGASVCTGCGADKVSTFRGHCIKNSSSLIAPLIASSVVGLFLALWLGFVTDSVFLLFVILIFAMCFPLIIYYFMKRGKEIWYR